MRNKNILIGVSGGISAYKVIELVRLLRAAGASTRVVMTQAAQQFVTPLSFHAISGAPVVTDAASNMAEDAMPHITLARYPDLIVLAPASANLVARLAHGMANDLLTTICLATTAPIIVAPAMNKIMWHNPATQHNMHLLQQRGMFISGPDMGEQACGDVGLGRMLEPEVLFETVRAQFQLPILSGKRIVITAGPTREAIDAVRYISNRSSGKMGYALARAAQSLGAQVTLISGPSALTPPPGVNYYPVITAQDMHTACLIHAPNCDFFIAAAAVSDYHCATPPQHKLQKTETLVLALTQTPDIVTTIASLPNAPFIVGFAAQTHDHHAYAQMKLRKKQLDMIVLNAVDDNTIGFDSDDNAVTVFTHHTLDQPMHFKKTSKTQLAIQLMEYIAKQWNNRAPTQI